MLSIKDWSNTNKYDLIEFKNLNVSSTFFMILINDQNKKVFWLYIWENSI